MRPIFRHRPSPAMVIACIALGIALGGTSVAAVNALPRNSVGTKQIKNGAVTKKKINKKTLTQLKGNRGPQGPQGAPGAAGAKGAQGIQGIQGPAGPITGDLPAGVTLRGTWGGEGSASGAGDYRGSTAMFGLRLPASPARHFIPDGGVPPASCPGTLTNPQAAPGHLCVYQGSNISNQSTGIDETNAGTGRYGFTFLIFALAAGNYWSYGTWAVTAPATAGPAAAPERAAPGAAGTSSAK
jgi:hypothetical protein